MKKSRQLLVIGSLPWFPDSFRIFVELGYRAAFVRMKTPPIDAFENGFKILVDAGFLEIADDGDAIETFLGEGEPTIVISGGDLLPTGAYMSLGDSIDKLRSFAAICNGARRRGDIILGVRFFNGETYFLDDSITSLVQDCLSAADLLLFDNNQLADYVYFNCPALKAVRHQISIVEAPLERFFPTQPADKIWPYILLLGRWPASFVSFATPTDRQRRRIFLGDLVSRRPPLRNRFATTLVDERHKNERYYLPTGVVTSRRHVAAAESIAVLDSERTMMASERAACVAGLSHFYDFPRSRTPKTPLSQHYGFLAQRYTPANYLGYSWPDIMRSINISSKAITYLMLGIPPIVPDEDEQPLTHLLNSKDMCFTIGPNNRSWAQDLVSIDAVRRKRQAVVNHGRLFAFERVLEHLNTAICSKFGWSVYS